MVARFVNKSRPSCSPSNHRFARRIASSCPSSSSCAPVKRILGKHHRMAIQHIRAPLANKAALVNRGSPPVRMATPAVPTPSASTTRIRLPRTLPRPALREIDMTIVEEAYPELRCLPPQYVRDKLAIVAPQMLAALRTVQACLPRSHGLPAELDVELDPESDEARVNPPTHMLAVYSSSSSSSSSSPLSCPAAAAKTKVTLFPAHQLVFSAYCANLPALPAPSMPPTSDALYRIPVVPFRLPVPAAFPQLYSYLYTKRADVLLAALTPTHDNDMASLTRLAAFIQGVWQNTCVLGVVDPVLYDTLDDAWGRVMTALERCQS